MKKDAGLIVLIVLGFALMLLWVGFSYLEASAYNHATGKSVSLFDAMFLDLRVQSEAK